MIIISQLVVLGEELKVGEDLQRDVHTCECWGLGMPHACSYLPLPLGHFRNLVTLLVKGFSSTLPQTSLLHGILFILELH